MLNINNEINDSVTSKQFNISLRLHTRSALISIRISLRKQKVDLLNIILELANQYINFINKYQDLHLEIAADYLVMASWLTYLTGDYFLPKEGNQMIIHLKNWKKLLNINFKD